MTALELIHRIQAVVEREAEFHKASGLSGPFDPRVVIAPQPPGDTCQEIGEVTWSYNEIEIRAWDEGD